jgi:hypothetical protein
MEELRKPFDEFLCYVATCLWFGGLILLIFEIKAIENTINGLKLVGFAGFLGIFLALFTTMELKKLNSSVYKAFDTRFIMYFGVFVGSFFLTLFAASILNRTFATKNKRARIYTIHSKFTGNKTGREIMNPFWLFLNIEEQGEERFDVPESIYRHVKEGDYVLLYTSRGLLGFDFVTEFKSLSNDKIIK